MGKYTLEDPELGLANPPKWASRIQIPPALLQQLGLPSNVPIGALNADFMATLDALLQGALVQNALSDAALDKIAGILECHGGMEEKRAKLIEMLYKALEDEEGAVTNAVLATPKDKAHQEVFQARIAGGKQLITAEKSAEIAYVNHDFANQLKAAANKFTKQKATSDKKYTADPKDNTTSEISEDELAERRRRKEAIKRFEQLKQGKGATK